MSRKGVSSWVVAIGLGSAVMTSAMAADLEACIPALEAVEVTKNTQPCLTHLVVRHGPDVMLADKCGTCNVCGTNFVKRWVPPDEENDQ